MKLFTKSVVASLVATFLPAFGFASEIVQTETLSAAYPNWNQTLQFNQFDTTQGTLTGITIILTLQSDDGSLAVHNKSTDAATVTYSFGATATLTSNDVRLTYTGLSLSTVSAVSSGSITLDGDAWSSPISFSTLSASGTGTVASSRYSDYQGTAQFGLTVNANQQISVQSAGGAEYTANPAKAEGTVTVVYTYTPTAVPEPTTWAMLFGGVGTLVLVQRMRSRKLA